MMQNTNPLDPALQKVISDVENELLQHIIANLKNSTLKVEEAQALAREFLEILPPKDKEDLLQKLKELSRKHPKEVLDIYVKYANPDVEEGREKALNSMLQHIKNGDIDKALAVAKEENT